MNDQFKRNIYIYLKVESLNLSFGEDSNLLSFSSFGINNNPLEKTIIIHGNIKNTNPEIVSLKYKKNSGTALSKRTKDIKETYLNSGIHFQLDIYGENKKKEDSLGHIEFIDFSEMKDTEYDKCLSISCTYEVSTFNELYKKLSDEPKSIQDICVTANYYVDKDRPTMGLEEIKELDFVEMPLIEISNVKFLYRYDYK